MAIELSEVTLPAYYVCAFINGDYSGLEDREIRLVDGLVDGLGQDGWMIVDVAHDEEGNEQEPRFTWSYRLYGGDAEGGDVLDYVICKQL